MTFSTSTDVWSRKRQRGDVEGVGRRCRRSREGLEGEDRLEVGGAEASSGDRNSQAGRLSERDRELPKPLRREHRYGRS